MITEILKESTLSLLWILLMSTILIFLSILTAAILRYSVSQYLMDMFNENKPPNWCFELYGKQIDAISYLIAYSITTIISILSVFTEPPKILIIVAASLFMVGFIQSTTIGYANSRVNYYITPLEKNNERNTK